MKLALGTVQFGLDYGISNAGGRVPEAEVKEILSRAHAVGVDLLDTAPAYGDSEAVIGRATDGFRVVTKLPPLDHARGDLGQQIREGIEASLHRLRRMFVYGLLVHNPADLKGPGGDEVAETLEELRSENRVEKIGVSIYDETDLSEAFGKGDFDLVQVPLNLLDQRLLRSGALAKLKAAGVEIHARSAFLQGLLLMQPSEVDDRFSSVRDHLAMVKSTVEDKGLTMLEAALGFVAGRPEVDHVVVGVCSAEEFTQAAIALTLAQQKTNSDWGFANSFAWSDEKVLNPSLWEKAGIAGNGA